MIPGPEAWETRGPAEGSCRSDDQQRATRPNKENQAGALRKRSFRCPKTPYQLKLLLGWEQLIVLTLSCPPYVLWEDFWVWFSRRGVHVSEKISEVGFLYGETCRHAQPHTNHKPVNLHLTEHGNINIFQIQAGQVDSCPVSSWTAAKHTNRSWSYQLHLSLRTAPKATNCT